MKKGIKVLLALLCYCNFINGQTLLSEKDITVLKEADNTMMRSYLTNIVDKQFAKRDSLLSTLKSAEDWGLRSQAIRDSMISWTGPFPERTPLNARVTGRVEREGYTIEKILFESRPGLFVSANLYLPENISIPRPVHINLIGHAPEGKADERYQRMSIAQAKNGFVVLTMDQLGQGERGERSLHHIIGTQAFISGTHIFNFMVWDVIRSIDYLVNRPEVDPEKICITGSSGGGMMATYVLPFDDRIKVSVPTCNPNTWSYRVRANLGADHEQVFFGAFESGIDPRGDPLFVQVPKPLLINATTDDDLNPPQGVWDLNKWLHKSYAAHGVPEKFTTTMVKAGHEYNKEQRQITYSWMSQWTGNGITDSDEEDILSEKDLWTTTSGSVFNEPGSKRLHELVLDYLRQNKAQWGEISTNKDVNDHRAKMTGLIKEVLNTNLDDIETTCDFMSTQNVGDITVRQFLLKPEPGILLPGVLLGVGQNISNQDIILYLNDKGKAEMLNDMYILEEMLRKGYSICAIDLRGIGETSPGMSNRFWDFLAGKPIFGQRVRDVLATVKWLKGSKVEAKNIKLWGSGMCALYSAFAGVVSNDISAFVFEKPLISFESVVQVDVPRYNHEVLLPGILEKFDMAQIYQALCPRPVLVVNPFSGDSSYARKSDVEEVQKLVSTTYDGLNSQKDWKILRASDYDRRKAILNRLDAN